MIDSDIPKSESRIPQSIEWLGNAVRFIDQTLLPLQEKTITTNDYREVIDAIRHLRLRGAPLIGVAAAYGAALAALQTTVPDIESFQREFAAIVKEIAAARPTAVNLQWALTRISRIAAAAASVREAQEALVREAMAIHTEDAERCRRIGEHGAALILKPSQILTHCNTGALATGGEGTALSVILHAYRNGKVLNVFVDETRPLLQGARLTTWELMRANVPATLLADNMAASLMRRGEVDLVITGADRIAANGDTANKIGTYGLAVLAKHHGIPFYIAAPTNTIDRGLPDGSLIPIEFRSSDEVTQGFGRRTAPEGINVYSPAFDITPGSLITAIITDEGVVRPPFAL